MDVKCWGYRVSFQPTRSRFACQNVGNPCSTPLLHITAKDTGLAPHILHINKASQSGLCLVLTSPLRVLRCSRGTLRHGSPSACLPVL